MAQHSKSTSSNTSTAPHRSAPKRPSAALCALTSAALALPAFAPLAQADSPPERTTLGYRYSLYQEDDMDAGKVALGSSERYDIAAHQFRLNTAVGDQWGLDANLQVESMSGASARATAQGSNGEPLAVMSGASISDKRYDLSLTPRRFFEEGSAAATVGYSKEDDYESANVAFEGEHHFNNRLTTLGGGIGYSMDKLSPTQETGFSRPTSEDKHSATAFLSLAQVINEVSQVQTSITIAMYDGYLSDPYKTQDIRPDRRLQWAWNNRFRYFFRNLKAALHADYRYYGDDWGVQSHTFEFAWYQNLDDNLQIVPSLRYYSQSQADFYYPIDSTLRTGDQSSDFRLSPYGALSAGIKVVAHTYDWRLTLAAERYESSGDYALRPVTTASPALVSYNLLTVGLDYSF